MPGWTTAVWFSSLTASSLFICVFKTTEMPPLSARLPKTTPDPALQVMIGILCALQYSTTLTTSSLFLGWTTRSGTASALFLRRARSSSMDLPWPYLTRLKSSVETFSRPDDIAESVHLVVAQRALPCEGDALVAGRERRAEVVVRHPELLLEHLVPGGVRVLELLGVVLEDPPVGSFGWDVVSPLRCETGGFAHLAFLC